MKRYIASFFTFSCLLMGTTAYAASSYTPLVNIPGLGSTVTISSYLIGIYNFLLSIVGIVAVMMLILGGMRIISAAGNPSSVSDGKNMVESAVVGLLLALLSWVVVSTINPDLLYLNAPTLTSVSGGTGYGLCGTFNSTATPNCTCRDGFTYTTTDQNECESKCTSNLHCDDYNTNLCLDPRYEEGSTDCICADGNGYSLGTYTTCQDLCIEEDRCPDDFGKFLYVKLHAGDTSTCAFSGSIYNTSASDVCPDGTTTRSSGGDEIWDLYLSNIGTDSSFDVTADYFGTDQDLSCAILVINEVPSWPDSIYIYWVKVGTTIGNSNNIYSSMGDYERCCGAFTSSDCNADLTSGNCDNAGADVVLKARFTSDILDESRNTLFSSDGSSYKFSKSITCIDGYWQ